MYKVHYLSVKRSMLFVLKQYVKYMSVSELYVAFVCVRENLTAVFVRVFVRVCVCDGKEEC